MPEMTLRGAGSTGGQFVKLLEQPPTCFCRKFTGVNFSVPSLPGGELRDIQWHAEYRPRPLAGIFAFFDMGMQARTRLWRYQIRPERVGC
jgi:hypothetical protein